MLSCYFDYIFVHLRQKVRLRPELGPKFLSTLGPNPTRKPRPDLQLWTKVLLFIILQRPKYCTVCFQGTSIVFSGVGKIFKKRGAFLV